MPYPLITALQNPALYPHAVTGFQVIETHLSWIILTGPFAYKIKKPLNLGFQDFTTLEKRQHYCELEIVYNQSLASKIYQTVIPITGSPEQPVFNGHGPVIEYAVQMIQFNPNDAFNILADNQQLTPNLIHALALQIAHFHRYQPSDVTGDFGIPLQVLAPMLANFSAIADLITDNDTRAIIKRLTDWTNHTYQTHRELLNLRKSAGAIRACHGDLHLGNIVLYQQKPLIFDCIEFNEDFRWIDVMSDTAFLSMDLDCHELTHLKWLFLNTYFDHTLDYNGATLLPFYQVYRAMVRAKIAILQARQNDVHSQMHLTCLAQFRHYIHLAESYTHKNTPTLMITVGPSGSGKSHYTQQLLAQNTQKTSTPGFIRLRSDVFRKHHFMLDLHCPSPEAERHRFYSEEATLLIYKQLNKTAELLLKTNQSVIIDAAFLKQSERQACFALAQRLNIPFKILAFDVPKDILIARLENRRLQGDHLSDATVEVLNKQLRHQEPLTAEERQYTQWVK